MSNVFDKHTVTGYVSGVTKPASGQRLASFNWKTSNDKDSIWFGLKRESKAVSLPPLAALDISANLVALTPAIIDWLHGVQDKVVREMLDRSSDLEFVSDSDISIAAVVEYLEDSAGESGRLTRASLEGWFTASLAEPLMVQLAAKLGVSEEVTDEESAKIEAVVAAFKGKIAALAGGKTSYSPSIATQLQKAVGLAPEGDIIADRMMVRLQKMIDSGNGASLLDAL